MAASRACKRNGTAYDQAAAELQYGDRYYSVPTVEQPIQTVGGDPLLQVNAKPFGFIIDYTKPNGFVSTR